MTVCNVLAVICSYMFWLGVRPLKSPLPVGIKDSHLNTISRRTPKAYAPNDIEIRETV